MIRKKTLKIADIAMMPKSAYFPNYQKYRIKILKVQVESLNQDCVKIERPYIQYLTINELSKSDTVGPVWPGQFIVLNELADPINL